MTMTHESQIKQWISEDEHRMEALQFARQCHLSDWCLAAGFVRNLVWDKLHGKREATPLNDIDLIYYNASHTAETRDIHYEAELHSMRDLPWSVKNQARMHLGNGDAPKNFERTIISLSQFGLRGYNFRAFYHEVLVHNILSKGYSLIAN